jgi:outer membrane protein OmpA-like peptidoglycan-associated protein
MKKTTVGHVVLVVFFLAIVMVMTSSWVSSASKRLEESVAKPNLAAANVAIASSADEGYCSTSLKQILKRVLTSCGLVKGGQSGRGCQPLEAKSVAAMSGDDFNALFRPLAQRASIIQFDQAKAELDDSARQLLEKTFSDQRGASYFFVVSRASPEGSVEKNRELSEQRAQAVLAHLKARFNDPDLEQEVGLLWLGEEFAQLDQEFCQWQRSRGQEECKTENLNRSAFIAWIDCRL